MSNQLLPCPFCGCEVRVNLVDVAYHPFHAACVLSETGFNAESWNYRATQPAAGVPKWSCLNDWFLSLEPGRQAVLREDKWMLAGAAFDAGRQCAAPPAAAHGDEIESLAVNRYRPTPDGLLHYKVVAGDGRRSLFTGTKAQCYLVAAKLTEAFLDGAYVQNSAAHEDEPK